MGHKVFNLKLKRSSQVGKTKAEFAVWNEKEVYNSLLPITLMEFISFETNEYVL